jgi:hydroxyacyl-ACP dehydratase HTD2-like protein with hotdog domain
MIPRNTFALIRAQNPKMLKPRSVFLRSLKSSASFSCHHWARRYQSTSARDVIGAFISDTNSIAHSPHKTTELLSPTQSDLLSLTLQPYLPFQVPCAETTLPQGHHLVYFPTAAVPESRLDSDGTETTFNPGPPFNRRMWAGGRIEWPRDVDLETCTETREEMSLDTIETKTRSGGGEMIIVSIEKKLFTEDGNEAVQETRQWVFLKDGDELAAKSSSSKKPAKREPRETAFRHSINLTPAALFRYSALIFNSHAIHLSKEHCLKEGHPDLVVHGPLTFSLLLEAVRGTVPKRWKSASYRAVGPAYVGETMTLNVGVEKEGKVEAWAEKGDGIPVMDVSIEFW